VCGGEIVGRKRWRRGAGFVALDGAPSEVGGVPRLGGRLRGLECTRGRSWSQLAGCGGWEMSSLAVLSQRADASVGASVNWCRWCGRFRVDGKFEVCLQLPNRGAGNHKSRLVMSPDVIGRRDGKVGPAHRGWGLFRLPDLFFTFTLTSPTCTTFIRSCRGAGRVPRQMPPVAPGQPCTKTTKKRDNPGSFLCCLDESCTDLQHANHGLWQSRITNLTCSLPEHRQSIRNMGIFPHGYSSPFVAIFPFPRRQAEACSLSLASMRAVLNVSARSTSRRPLKEGEDVASNFAVPRQLTVTERGIFRASDCRRALLPKRHRYLAGTGSPEAPCVLRPPVSVGMGEWQRPWRSRSAFAVGCGVTSCDCH
jgi:hypothetical protein